MPLSSEEKSNLTAIVEKHNEQGFTLYVPERTPLTTQPEGTTPWRSMNLDDLVHYHAYLIELALIKAGAVPSRDYSLMDVIKLAQPYAVAAYSDNLRM